MKLYDAAKTITALEAAERYAGVQVKRRGTKSWCRCPLPSHPADNTPSCSFDDNGRFYCFGCNEGGTSIDMTMKLLDLPAREAAMRICTDFGVEYENTKPAKRTKPRVTTAQVDELLTRFDTAACWMLRFLNGAVERKQPAPDDEPSEDFMKALHERNVMKDLCGRMQEALNAGDREAALDLVEAYRADFAKWEKIAAAWKKEVEA